jgi:nicotinamide riboside kinase
MPFSRLPRLILTGPESTGKSALAHSLSDYLDGILVQEYLRDYFEAQGSLTLEDAIPIAQGQWVNEERGAEEAEAQNKILVCDTDLLSSLVYTTHYYPQDMNCPTWALWEKWAERHKRRLAAAPFSPRLYILCDVDWPWVDDGQRDAPDQRPQFFKRFEAELQAMGCDYITVSGSLDERLSAVLAHLVRDHLHKQKD